MSKSSGNGGMGFGTVLFLIFLVLKLTHYINWSWWWVTAPLWITTAFAVLTIIVLAILQAKARNDRHRKYFNS